MIGIVEYISAEGMFGLNYLRNGIGKSFMDIKMNKLTSSAKAETMFSGALHISSRNLGPVPNTDHSSNSGTLKIAPGH